MACFFLSLTSIPPAKRASAMNEQPYLAFTESLRVIPSSSRLCPSPPRYTNNLAGTKDRAGHSHGQAAFDSFRTARGD